MSRLVVCPHCGQQHGYTLAICPNKALPLPLGARRHAPPPPPPPPALGATPSGSAPRPVNGRRRPYADHDLLGATLDGKYNVVGVLGEGGMGTVYEAQHVTLRRAVAVKVLHARQMRKQEAVLRFHHEARAAGAIGHPNICEVYDLGTLADGRPYLVMERLVGETLSDRIEEHGSLPASEVSDVLTQVLSGLVAAHQKGILHRDIKPENVFLATRVGCPPVAKLLDFGVSKVVGASSAIAEEADLTRTGMVMGTPYYMSPEQARGDRNLDARVDIYACGVLGYEALAGRRPFVANNYNALLIQILDGTPPPLLSLRPDLPPAFARILETAMARERTQRYRNATEFQEDLQLLWEQPTPSRQLANPHPARLELSQDVSFVELPSDVLDSHHSVEVQALGEPEPPVYDDNLETEVRLHDYSLPYDDDAATTLMRDEEIHELASRARPSAAYLAVAAPAVAAPALDKPELYNAEDTTKIQRAALSRPMPPPDRVPKSRR